MKDHTYFIPGKSYKNSKNHKTVVVASTTEARVLFKSAEIVGKDRKNHKFALYYSQCQNYEAVK